ncbi:ABC transporter permease subunit [Pseudothermotoga sp.]|nr:ABC transporter permease subunit [Pseudothermotoga sp.]MCX7813721.1 ABC transporter permease subunit [Pseudothermotoga sp.]MDW8140419.1 ABC transporter permease subunit [Pseudothermotoga sp.]
MHGFGKLLGLFFVGLLNVFFFWIAFFLFGNAYYALGTLFIVLVMLIDFFIFNPRGYPYRYVAPALVLLTVLVIYPIYFTIKTAFTNYGTGHYMSKEEAIERLLYDPVYTYQVENDSVEYKVFVAYDGFTASHDDFLILFKIDGELFVGEKPSPVKRKGKDVLLSEAQLTLVKGSAYQLVPQSNELAQIRMILLGEKTYKAFYSPREEFLKVNEPTFKSRIGQIHLHRSDYVHPSGNKYALRMDRTGEWSFVRIERLYRLDLLQTAEDGKPKTKVVVVNNRTNRPLIEKEGSFYDVNENGEEVYLIGYIDFVGWKNFSRVLKDPRIAGPFLKIFAWTFVWAVLSVIVSLAVGLPFALVLNDPKLKGRNIYRTLLIVPWAIPVFISALVWRNGLLNESYGVINKFLLPALGLPALRWMNDPFWARVGVILVNVWLTYPYMMTISLGALQGIPYELYEAAMIDGAGKFKRFWNITFPLLMTVIAPLLVSSFAFSFNNFTIIYLITGGGPPIPGSTTPTGYTDILISYVYKLAFQAGTGQDFGLAAAISILIFFLVGGISYFNFRFSGVFEEVGK